MFIRKKTLKGRLLIGRDEWCGLPDLSIPAIKAKIDTGAKTSALHAFNIKTMRRNKKLFAKFDIHPIQGNKNIIITCRAPIIDERLIMSSNGHKEHRYVIQTQLKIGSECWSIELTLSNRDPLRYRMLLGREALVNRVLINPAMTCHQGKVNRTLLGKIYPIN